MKCQIYRMYFFAEYFVATTYTRLFLHRFWGNKYSRFSETLQRSANISKICHKFSVTETEGYLKDPEPVLCFILMYFPLFSRTSSWRPGGRTPAASRSRRTPTTLSSRLGAPGSSTLWWSTIRRRQTSWSNPCHQASKLRSLSEQWHRDPSFISKFIKSGEIQETP